MTTVKKPVVIVGGVVLVAVIALIAILAWPRGSDPVSEQDALESFRQQSEDKETTSTTEARQEDAPREGSSSEAPEAGVYRYQGSGSETVQLGPIPSETREFPTEINGVVTAGEPSADGACFVMTLNLIEQHTEDSTYCRTAEGGLRLDHYEKHQQVSAFNATVDIRCDPGVLWQPGESEFPVKCSLELLGGPKAVKVDLTGTATVTEGATRDLDGEQRDVVEVLVHFDIEGSITGTWDETLTFTTDDALLVGIDRLFDLKGFASFLEDFGYELISATPTT